MEEESMQIEHICEELLYTTNEVSRKLKVTPKAVREWIGRGELEAIDLGQGYRILQRDLDAFLLKRKARSNSKRKKEACEHSPGEK